MKIINPIILILWVKVSKLFIYLHIRYCTKNIILILDNAQKKIVWQFKLSDYSPLEKLLLKLPKGKYEILTNTQANAILNKLSIGEEVCIFLASLITINPNNMLINHQILILKPIIQYFFWKFYLNPLWLNKYSNKLIFFAKWTMIVSILWNETAIFST